MRGPPPSPFSYLHRWQPLPHRSHVVDCGTGHIFLMFGCLRLQTHADLIEPSGRRPQREGVCPDPPAGRVWGRDSGRSWVPGELAEPVAWLWV